MIRKIFAFALAVFSVSLLSAQQAAPANQPVPQQPAATQPAAQPPATAQPAPQQPAVAQPTASAQQPATAPATAPTDAQAAEPAPPVIHVGVNEVNLIFTVTDKHGRYISNLQQSDFSLTDDGHAPTKVTSFRQQINLPLRVGVLIDTSTSIRTRFKFEQDSASEFLLQILKAKSDRSFVMGFDSTPTVTQDWSNNVDALETGINRLRPGGATALFDAVYTACRDKLLSGARDREPVRKAIVLLSDGDDNQSRVYRDEAIKECQRAETIIYAISTNWTPSRGQGDDVLTKMATETGGQVFFPPSVEEVSNSFHSIEEELRSQYALTYTPFNFMTNGSFRPIYLFCNNRSYVARARKGYFAPKE